jgi:DnaJ-class molecular chaperone
MGLKYRYATINNIGFATSGNVGTIAELNNTLRNLFNKTVRTWTLLREPLTFDVEIDFVSAINGVNVEIELNKRVLCHTCRGTRAAKDSKPRKCFDCGGRGSIIGNYGIKKRCTKCDGAGCVPKVRCPDCEGLGVQR